MFGSSVHLDKCETSGLNVCGEHVQLSGGIRYLGAHFDSHLNLKHHISLKCRAAMWNIQRIKLIRHILTPDTCETLVLGTVISHLDYANTLYLGLPQCDIKRLQRVQNIAPKLVLQSSEDSTLHSVSNNSNGYQSILELNIKC